MKTEGIHIIHELQKKWSARLLTAAVLLAVAIAAGAASVFYFVFHLPWYAIAVMVAAIVAVVFRFTYKKIHAEDVSGYLNKTHHEFEESAGLFLRDKEELNLLQQLQVHKLSSSFSAGIRQPAVITRQLRSGAIFLLLSVVISAGLYFLSLGQDKTHAPGIESNKTESILPQIEKVIVTISPPAYTGKKTRQQNRFNLSAEESSHLGWQLTTNIAAKKVELLFNDSTVINLQSPGNNSTEWKAQKVMEHPGFYQVRIDGSLSELYQLELLRDAPPAITVQSPKPNTLIEPWMAMQSQVQVGVTDDYGIKNAFIAATISSGAGEAVKFKQATISFPGFSPGASRYQLQKLIDLRALGMGKGDELYFYVSATDTKGQERKSDMYIVRVEDTAKLLSIDGLANGLDLKVDFFRSQRQLIIETEQLLRDKDTISVAEFNKRSNNLGIDQKLLRMRYSKFLGEENNAEVGETAGESGHDDHDGHGAEGDQSQALLSAVTHNHDNAEDATFFDPETKKQLQATLTEMWKSELRLRTMKPREALPFEYAALRLLKELQQSSRVYVAKTGVKMPPLKLEKRLTGELDKITPYTLQRNIEQAEDEMLSLRKAMGVIEQVRNHETITPSSQSILEQAGIALGRKAAEEPALYLAGFEAYRRIVLKQNKPNDAALAGKALQKIIADSQKQPFTSHTNADMGLSQRYFNHINRAHD